MGQTEVRGFVHVCPRGAGRGWEGSQSEETGLGGPREFRPRGEWTGSHRDQEPILLISVSDCLFFVDSQIICFKKIRNFQKISFILRNRYHQ